MVQEPEDDDQRKVLHAAFFAYENGSQPVREWLLSLDDESRELIGLDLATVEFEWPVGEPLIKKVGEFWELRTRLEIGWSRVFFIIDGNKAVLLHGFVKKSKKPERHDVETALSRLKNFRARRED
jgi:phage-related protein